MHFWSIQHCQLEVCILYAEPSLFSELLYLEYYYKDELPGQMCLKSVFFFAWLCHVLRILTLDGGIELHNLQLLAFFLVCGIVFVGRYVINSATYRVKHLYYHVNLETSF